MFYRKGILFCTAAIGAIATAMPALAQDGSIASAPGTASQNASDTALATAPGDMESGLQDIIVTAQRRSESLQRAAISISAISGDQLQSRGVVNAEQLTQAVPALRTLPGQGPYANFSVRGISNTAQNINQEGAIVINADGVPLVHSTSVHGLFYDLERVEVLKGPQGILYGRNATGGAINVITRKPQSDFGANVAVDLGNYSKISVNGAINVPLAADLFARFAFQVVDRDGYYSDGTSDEKAAAGRLSLRYEPNSDLSLTLIGDWDHDTGRGYGASALRPDARGGGFIGGPFVGLSDPRVTPAFTAIGSAPHITEPRQSNYYRGVSLIAEVSTGIGNLTIIPSYRNTKIYFASLAPGFYFVEDSKADQFSLEGRLSSPDDQRLRYVIGGFYLNDLVDAHQLTEQGTTLTNQIYNNKLWTGAGFGQLTFDVLDNFRLVGGLRYTYEKKNFAGARRNIANFPFATTMVVPLPDSSQGVIATDVTGSNSWKSLNYKLGAEWQATPDSLIYANFSTGFKGGGFFLGPAGRNTFDPEHVRSAVLGTKNLFFDRRLQLNVEAFYMRYSDQQIQHTAFLPTGGNFTITDNVGKATLYGIELDSQFLLTPQTHLSLQAQWEFSNYDSFTYLSATPVNNNQACPFSVVPSGGFQIDCSGGRLPQTPEWVISAGIDHRFELANGAAIVPSVDGRFESKRTTSITYLPETFVGSYAIANASITFSAPEDRWSVSAYVQNLTDRDVIVRSEPQRNYSIAASATSGFFITTLQPPRTYGVRLRARF